MFMAVTYSTQFNFPTCHKSPVAQWQSFWTRNQMPPVPDPDLEIRGRPRTPPLDKGGGAVSQKGFFGPSASVQSKIKRGAGPTGPLPWIHHWPVPVPVYEHHSQNDMFFLISNSWSRCNFFVHRNTCGNPAEVPILFLFCFVLPVFFFLFSIEHFYMITVRSHWCSDP